MITREKLQRGEGELVAENPFIGLRKRASFKEKMASDEGISQEDKDFWKTFHAMSEMVTILYEDYLERKRPVLGNTSKGKSEEEEDHPHIPPSPPSTPPSLLLLQVQVQNLMRRKMYISINMKCHY